MSDQSLDFQPFSGAREALASGRLRALLAAMLDHVRRSRRVAANRRAARSLAGLEDWRLRDIGLTRNDIRRAAAEGRLLK
jgi:uncharacterized protein YjiS (DUF1127 family)